MKAREVKDGEATEVKDDRAPSSSILPEPAPGQL